MKRTGIVSSLTHELPSCSRTYRVEKTAKRKKRNDTTRLTSITGRKGVSLSSWSMTFLFLSRSLCINYLESIGSRTKWPTNVYTIGPFIIRGLFIGCNRRKTQLAFKGILLVFLLFFSRHCERLQRKRKSDALWMVLVVHRGAQITRTEFFSSPCRWRRYCISGRAAERLAYRISSWLEKRTRKKRREISRGVLRSLVNSFSLALSLFSLLLMVLSSASFSLLHRSLEVNGRTKKKKTKKRRKMKHKNRKEKRRNREGPVSILNYIRWQRCFWTLTWF